MLIMQISSIPSPSHQGIHSWGYERLLRPLLASFASQMRVKFLRLLPTAFVPLWVAYDLWHSDRTHIKCASNSARFFCVCVCVCVMSVRSVSTVNPLILPAVSSLFRYHFQLFMNATASHLLWNVCQCVCMCVCIHSLCYYDQKRIYSVFIFLFTRFFTQFFDSRCCHHVYSWNAQVFYYWNVHLE